MTNSYLQLKKIVFSGSVEPVELDFKPGINVICGASDTGKSFLAESIDFMLGGKELRGVPELDCYGKIALDLLSTSNDHWRFQRAVSGGGFKYSDLKSIDDKESKLKQKHENGKVDNLSGFLLDKIGLLDKRILRSSKSGETVGLSFRNLMKFAIIQEDEIQQKGSPFWSGQYTTKTSELAIAKLLLTGVDDSCVVQIDKSGSDNSKQIDLIDELLEELDHDISVVGEEAEITGQLDRLEKTIVEQKQALAVEQKKLDELLEAKREVFTEIQEVKSRQREIAELLERFELLDEHYRVDIERLKSIQESGYVFVHIEIAACPLCGAEPDAQHTDQDCDGNVESIMLAATAEITKIEKLKAELVGAVKALDQEAFVLEINLKKKREEHQEFTTEVQEIMSPQVSGLRSIFTELIEKRSEVQKAKDLYDQQDKLLRRKASLLEEDEAKDDQKITFGIPKATAHEFSLKVGNLLNSWHFPGDCHVHFDEKASDFVIDGKPRGSRGKGLRAITHAAVTIGLLEYCQEHGLPHPGFVVLDSPLLAYYEPEGDDDRELQGTDLKERFYEYLTQHHATGSQVVIIENQHPPRKFISDLELTIFSGNPTQGREGLL